MQPARGGWHLPRSCLLSVNLPVFSLDGVILADALPPLPSTLNDQESSRVETGASSLLTAASTSCTLGAAVDAAPSLPLRRYGEMVILFAYQIGTQLDKPEVQPS